MDVLLTVDNSKILREVYQAGPFSSPFGFKLLWMSFKCAKQNNKEILECLFPSWNLGKADMFFLFPCGVLFCFIGFSLSEHVFLMNRRSGE